MAGLAALKALGDRYGIRFPARHGNLLPETNWDNQIRASRILGQTHLGESGLPNNTNGYNTWDRLLATAQQMNRLGKRSVEAGLGPAYFHNHNDEFSRRYIPETGESCPTTSTEHRVQELVGDHHGQDRSALGRGADRHRLGRVRLGVRHAA